LAGIPYHIGSLLGDILCATVSNSVLQDRGVEIDEQAERQAGEL
jgi:hypothetical protein